MPKQLCRANAFAMQIFCRWSTRGWGFGKRKPLKRLKHLSFSQLRIMPVLIFLSFPAIAFPCLLLCFAIYVDQRQKTCIEALNQDRECPTAMERSVSQRGKGLEGGMSERKSGKGRGVAKGREDGSGLGWGRERGGKEHGLRAGGRAGAKREIGARRQSKSERAKDKGEGEREGELKPKG